jgi:hypothetical protein
VRWSIDSADAYSVAKVRRAVIEELRCITGPDADLFTLEVVLGELLAGEMERGHLALAVIVEQAPDAPSVHVYTQGGGQAANSTQGELRAAIIREAHVPMSIETTAQSRHYAISVPSIPEREVVDRIR